MLEEKVLRYVYIRDKGRCIICGTKNNLEAVPHHCFYRSEYFKEDRDEEWNLVTLCRKCHQAIHFGNKKLQKLCKEIALNRYRGKYRDELKKIMKGKGF